MAFATIEEVCTELQRRVARNQPMDTEQTLGMLLVIAESVRALKAAAIGISTPQKPESPAADAPKEQTIQRHL